MRVDQYRNFSVEDFVLDAAFKQAVLKHPESASPLLHAIGRAYPEKRETIAKASQLVRELQKQHEAKPLGEEEKRQLKRRILSSAKRTEPGRHNPYPFRKRARILIGLAASLMLVMLSVYSIWPAQEIETITYTTGPGEQRVILLPDGSLVTLNAVSRLLVPGPWKETEDREVWLEGEAFFSVKKKPANDAKFTVHTNALDVDVLGTQFNVMANPDSTHISLEEGMIRLRLTETPASEGEAAIIMREGDFARFVKGRGLQKSSSSQPEKFSSWRDGYIPLEAARLADLVKIIERSYGMDLISKVPELEERKVSGVLPSQELEELLITLEALYSVHVKREDTQIILYK